MHKEAFCPNFFAFQQLMISPIIVKIPSFPFFSSLHKKIHQSFKIFDLLPQSQHHDTGQDMHAHEPLALGPALYLGTPSLHHHPAYS
jgi:hypothetical protein